MRLAVVAAIVLLMRAATARSGRARGKLYRNDNPGHRGNMYY